LTGDAGRGCGDASRALLFVQKHNALCGRSRLCAAAARHTPQQQKIRRAVKRAGFF